MPRGPVPDHGRVELSELVYAESRWDFVEERPPRPASCGLSSGASDSCGCGGSHNPDARGASAGVSPGQAGRIARLATGGGDGP